MDPEALVRDALSRLLERKRDDAFLVVEVEGSQDFVQFAGCEQGTLLLDLPTQPLDPGALYRAEELFRELGVALERQALFDGPGGERVGTQQTFQYELGDDVERGAALAMRVLREVYQAADPIRVTLVEN